MNNTFDIIAKRRSVRSFRAGGISQDDLSWLVDFIAGIKNPFGIAVDFKILSAKENGLSSPVLVGEELYLGGKVKRVPYAHEAFGYSMESAILQAAGMGIGTVWLGGTMNRGAFEAAMCLGADEMMPCVTPLGYAADKMSVRERMMRSAISVDERLPFGKLFFCGEQCAPLTEENAGALLEPLRAVRLAPSAVNKQPWRVVVLGNSAHFYLKRSKSVNSSAPDMQRVDMGIALCHMSFALDECGLEYGFSLTDPAISVPDGLEYVASFINIG